MKRLGDSMVASESMEEFARIMEAGSPYPGALQAPEKTAMGGNGSRINLEQGKGKNGVAQLVLTLVKLLHELLERQAIRRVEGGSLSGEEIERLGLTLMNQSREIEKMRKAYGFEEEDLNIDLGPLGKLL